MELKDKLEKLVSHFKQTYKFDFETLDESDRRLLITNSRTLRLKRKENLYKQGEPVKAVYMLKKGIVKAYQTNVNGSIQILFFYKQGDLFGYRPLFSDMINPISIAAIEDCELLVFDKNIFLEVAKHSLLLCNQLLKGFSAEFSVFTNKINMCSQIGKKERLALSLLLLNYTFSKSNKIDPEVPVEIKLTRTDLANYVGTSLENLIRMMNTFKQKKLIRVVGKSIYILNFEELLNISTFE